MYNKLDNFIETKMKWISQMINMSDLTIIPAVKGESMAIVLWYLNLVCVEAGSMFFSCLREPVWIMDQISKNIIHFLRLFGCIIQTEILGDFRLLKLFTNFMKQNFMTQEVSWPSWTGASRCSAAGASLCTRVWSPFSGRFYLYLIFIFCFSIYLNIRGLSIYFKDFCSSPRQLIRRCNRICI